MSKEKEFLFKINAYTPKTIPMARLAEYMVELANLLGEKDSVHFERLVQGSTGLKYTVKHEAETKVRERIRLVHNNSAPADAQKAFKAINKKLKEDNGDAVIQDASAEIIAFPGTKEQEIPVFGPISQAGTIDGVVIRLGGKNEVVPVTIQTRDGQELTCKANRPLAKDLSAYLFTQEVRCIGAGRWIRNDESKWILETFTITGFEPLDSDDLGKTVSDLRAIKGSGWKDVSNPWKELKDLRGDD